MCDDAFGAARDFLFGAGARWAGRGSAQCLAPQPHLYVEKALLALALEVDAAARDAGSEGGGGGVWQKGFCRAGPSTACALARPGRCIAQAYSNAGLP